ncbi:MAG: HAMP domain-containing histidine kinase [Burkholderiales bacterium]|nr:HAMP domain-containing histidine kinase [Burkholderiales bacterium]
MILRALCAFGAVALENARAYQRLQDAQMQLVAQAKMAALGSLVAGVAHELNTPIGNSLLIATTLELMVERFYQKCTESPVRRSELLSFLESARESANLVARGLHNASHLVSSFKQVATDRAHEQRRVFKLQQLALEIIATVQGQINERGHSVTLAVPAEIEMDSYPGPLGQVFSNLIQNALLHAFGSRNGGNMILSAKHLSSERIEIIFQDDGCGIAANNLKRVFDPFFTTTMGKGSNGLGLHISYNIVTSILNGEISVANRRHWPRIDLEC